MRLQEERLIEGPLQFGIVLGVPGGIAATAANLAHIVPTDESMLSERVAARDSHFMPAALVQSQISDLELLTADEAGAIVRTHVSPEVVVRQVEEAICVVDEEAY